MNTHTLWLAAALAACVAGPSLAQSSAAVSLSTGFDYSSGDYGSDLGKTEILVLPMTASYRADVFRFSATLPYLRIDGPGGVVLGPDGRPLPGVPEADGRRSGLGDLSLGAAATFAPRALGGVELDLTGRVKLPTSDKDKALGTGKTDFSVAAEATYPIGIWAPFVSVGYRIPGDPPQIDLRNTFTASAGTSVVLGRTVAILSYDYAEAASPLSEDSRELFAAVSAPLSGRLNWSLYGVAGLSDGSPDYGVGLLLTAKLR